MFKQVSKYLGIRTKNDVLVENQTKIQALQVSVESVHQKAKALAAANSHQWNNLKEETPSKES